MKCNCGDKDCETTLDLETTSNYVLLGLETKTSTGKNRINIYLDPNSIVKLIKDLKQSLDTIIS